MQTILFDIETDGLLEKLTKIHCIAYQITEDGEDGDVQLADALTGFEKVLDLLANADRIVAHNAFSFDIPVLKKIFPGWEYKGQVIDTLVMSQALWNDIMLSDFGRMKKGFPPRLKGSHSLEAYGYRLGELKGDYGKQENAWEKYTQEMAEYCKQDVRVLKKLHDKIMDRAPATMIALEMDFKKHITKLEERGVYFNQEDCVELMLKLRERKEEIEKELQSVFPPVYKPVQNGKVFTARGKSKKMPGLEKGSEFCKIEIQVFNPGSRQQIAERLIERYGWEPQQYTEAGSIVVNETVLSELEYPEAKLLNEYLMISKRLGQISDGNAGWLKLVTSENRIHGRIKTAGAVSGRCTHVAPNLAQVPASHSPYGKECRSLFTVPEGYKMVGCDASGLELRCLAHYLARYDGGEYGQIVRHGDIHTANQKAAGLPERNMAKTFIYGWLYGAGPAKIGSIIGGGAEDGAKLQARFMRQFPAIKQLKDGIANVLKKRNYLTGLDGRRLKTRSEHSALNLLLQSAGALIMKRWFIEVNEEIEARGLDACPVLNVHDEAQFEVKEDQAEELARICEEAMIKAGEYFDFRILIEGEAKIGDNWAETH